MTSVCITLNEEEFQAPLSLLQSSVYFKELLEIQGDNIVILDSNISVDFFTVLLLMCQTNDNIFREALKLFNKLKLSVKFSYNMNSDLMIPIVLNNKEFNVPGSLLEASGYFADSLISQNGNLVISDSEISTDYFTVLLIMCQPHKDIINETAYLFEQLRIPGADDIMKQYSCKKLHCRNICFGGDYCDEHTDYKSLKISSKPTSRSSSSKSASGTSNSKTTFRSSSGKSASRSSSSKTTSGSSSKKPASGSSSSKSASRSSSSKSASRSSSSKSASGISSSKSASGTSSRHTSSRPARPKPLGESFSDTKTTSYYIPYPLQYKDVNIASTCYHNSTTTAHRRGGNNKSACIIQ